MVQIKQSILFVLAALSVASAAPLQGRSANTVLNDFRSLQSAIGSFNSALSGFDGTSWFGAIAVSQASTGVDNAVKQLTKDINASSAFSSSDSSSIASAATSLANVVVISQREFVAKQPLFSRAGLDPFVVQQLNAQQTDNQALASALLSKSKSQDQPAIQTATKLLVKTFQNTVNVFSK